MVEKTRHDINEAKIKVIVKKLDNFDHHLLIYAKKPVFWLTILGTTAIMEYHNFLCVRYTGTPPQ